MANNMIDDMFKNQVPKKKKGKKIVGILIILLLVAIAVAAVAAFLILRNQNKPTAKDGFVQYLGKDSFKTVLNLEKMNAFTNRVQSEITESTTDITGNLSAGVFGSDIDLSEIKVNINSQRNPVEDISSSDVAVTYKDNEIFSLNALTDSEKIGIISEDVIIKYIASDFSNLGDVLSRIFDEESFANINFEQFKNANMTIPQLPENALAKYIEIINHKIPENAFTSKPITLDQSSGEKVSVTEYTMQLNETQAIELFDQILQTFEKDDELLDVLFGFLGDEKEQIKELLKSQIEVYINSLYENVPDNSKIYTVKVYGSNDVTYKISIDLYGKYTIDIDYNYGQTENSVTVTLLETEEQRGYSIDIVKTISDVTEKIEFSLNIIEESDIVGKFELVSDLVNSGNSYTLKNTLDVNFMSFTLSIQTNSKINFKQTEIDKLSESNTVFLDELNDDTFEDIVTAVKERSAEVIKENLIEQGVIEPEEEPEDSENQTTPPSAVDTAEEKEKAKNKLISAISEAMTNAINEGKTYSLNDLMTLEIPDSTFSVSIDGDIATLNIDGFEFKLNSEFQLYE